MAWWVAGLRPFTWPPLGAVVVAGLASVVLGRRAPRPDRRSDLGRAGGGGVWVVLVAALAGWELAAYVQEPRVDHPTLSSLANEVLDRRPARTAAFLVWLAVGAGVARR